MRRVTARLLKFLICQLVPQRAYAADLSLADRGGPRERFNTFNGKRVGKRGLSSAGGGGEGCGMGYSITRRRCAVERSALSSRTYCIYNRFSRPVAYLIVAAAAAPTPRPPPGLFTLHKLFSGRLTRNLVCEGARRHRSPLLTPAFPCSYAGVVYTSATEFANKARRSFKNEFSRLIKPGMGSCKSIYTRIYIYIYTCRGDKHGRFA